MNGRSRCRRGAGPIACRAGRCHPRRAPRKAYHIPAVLRDSFAVAMGALIAASVLLAATGIYQVGYDNGLKAQGVAHVER